MKKGIAIMLVFMMILGVSVMASAQGQGGQPVFEATISIEGNMNVTVGQSTTFTAPWYTNKDVTREEWSVDMVGEGTVNIDGASSGTSSFTFDSTGLDVGEYQVCFRVWHHQQSDRNAVESVTIRVVAEAVSECPAAPAVANALLDKVGFTGDRGAILRDVAKEMGPQTDFHGHPKCIDGSPNPAYKEAVQAFLESEYDYEIHAVQNLYGDVNGDGTVDVRDVIIALRHIVGLINIEETYGPVALRHRSRVSSPNGDIDVGDAILILRYIVGLITVFPVE